MSLCPIPKVIKTSSHYKPSTCTGSASSSISVACVICIARRVLGMSYRASPLNYLEVFSICVQNFGLQLRTDLQCLMYIWYILSSYRTLIIIVVLLCINWPIWVRLYQLRTVCNEQYFVNSWFLCSRFLQLLVCVYNWQHLEKNVGVESDHLLTSLVAIGHLAQLYPSLFAQSTHNIVSRFVVKELMMQVRVRSTL